MTDPQFEREHIYNLSITERNTLDLLQIESLKMRAYQNRKLLQEYGPLNAVNEFEKALSLIKISKHGEFREKTKVHITRALLMDSSFLFAYIQSAELGTLRAQT